MFEKKRKKTSVTNVALGSCQVTGERKLTWQPKKLGDLGHHCDKPYIPAFLADGEGFFFFFFIFLFFIIIIFLIIV
jgi:hypothetical protein